MYSWSGLFYTNQVPMRLTRDVFRHVSLLLTFTSFKLQLRSVQDRYSQRRTYVYAANASKLANTGTSDDDEHSLLMSITMKDRTPCQSIHPTHPTRQPVRQADPKCECCADAGPQRHSESKVDMAARCKAEHKHWRFGKLAVPGNDRTSNPNPVLQSTKAEPTLNSRASQHRTRKQKASDISLLFCLASSCRSRRARPLRQSRNPAVLER